MGFFKDPDPEEINKWVCILERGTEYEVAMAKNFLSNLEIPSNILSKRDSSYNLNIGDTSMVYLYVPVEYEMEARQALAELEDNSSSDMSDDDDTNNEPNDLTPRQDSDAEENRTHPPHRPSSDDENREEI